MSADLHVSTVEAREYLRVSLDRSGRGRSLEEQQADHVQDAAAHGWRLGTPYRDESISASRYSRKARDGFDELLADLEADRFGAAVLVLWESSRGSRRVGEWTLLLDLCEQRGVKLWVHTHGRLYDAVNGRDRRSLLEDAVDSEYESSKTSVRSKRAAAANAVAGRPSGRVPFGWRRVFDPMTRRLVAQEPHPEEAPVVVELYRRLLAGHSLKGITRDFAARGIVSHTGRPFSHQHLRTVALCPTHGGLRAHCPREAGLRREIELNSLHEGTWEPLVPRADWYAVQRILRAPERVTGRSGRARHWLSMIARCDRCGGPMAAVSRDGSDAYVCRDKGCVSISKADTDKAVEAVVLDYLANPEVIAALRGRDTTDDAELTRVRGELVAARAQHEELADAVAAGRISVALAARSEPAMLGTIATLEGRERELSTPGALRGLIELGEDVAQRWADVPISAARDVARILLTAELIGTLRIVRAPRPGLRVPARERLRFVTAADVAADGGTGA